MASADPAYLREEQYRDATNLAARITLHERYSTASEPFHRWLFDHMDVPAEIDLLEIGCGTGVFWRQNADRLPRGWRLTLTDFSPGMLDTAQDTVAELGLESELEVADAQDLPFPDHSFDVVMANFMLFHVPDRRRAFAEMHRVLRPGGRLYAATNGSTHLREIREWERRFGLPTIFGATSSAQAFGLQNGATQMAPWFTDIQTLRHEDELRVDDAEAVVAHVRSKLSEPEAFEGRLAALHQFLEQEIATHGPLRITKASGVFSAVRR